LAKISHILSENFQPCLKKAFGVPMHSMTKRMRVLEQDFITANRTAAEVAGRTLSAIELPRTPPPTQGDGK